MHTTGVALLLQRWLPHACLHVYYCTSRSGGSLSSFEYHPPPGVDLVSCSFPGLLCLCAFVCGISATGTDQRQQAHSITMLSLAKRIRETVTPARKTSAFLTQGVLTPEEFVEAGEQLVYKCPTWTWCDWSRLGTPKLLGRGWRFGVAIVGGRNAEL